MNYIAWDSETFRFSEGNMLPKMVCASFAYRDEDGSVITKLIGNGPDEDLEGFLRWLFTQTDFKLITQNGAYDYGVAMATFPDLAPIIWELIFSGRCTDTLWREKLLNLSTSGRLDKVPMPDGSTVRVGYSLGDFVMKYHGLDRSEDKIGEDIWRINYQVLDGWHSEEYPEGAAGYALQDATDTLAVYESQDERKDEWSMASTETEEFQLLKSFTLMLMTAWGMEGNPEAIDKMEAGVNEVIEQNKDLLEAEGILRPDNIVGPPMKKNFDAACALLPTQYVEGMDWTPYADAMKAQGIKFKKSTAKPGSKDTKRLQAYVAALYKRLGEIPTETPAGAICLDAEVKEYLAGKDEVMAQLCERESLSKLTSQMIPALRSGRIIHPSYNAILETGRTSSYDGGKPRKGGDGLRLYPSVNIQQIPNKITGRKTTDAEGNVSQVSFDPRRCFKARDGRVFFDVDFSGLELACTGFITDQLFGESVHLERYNAGFDLHAYLGAQLAIGVDKDMAAEFGQACRAEGIISDPVEVYYAFKELSGHEDPAVKKFYKHYRNFAKPVGLGFPGGLGAATMVDFARKTYWVNMTEEEAAEFKEMWLEVYPEMVLFFQWINTQIDEYNEGQNHKFGRPEDLYFYESPMGMIRRGASFCAGANGKVMQTPGAEAAMTGAAFVSRACYDPSQESVLFGCRPIAFVHDQIIGETTTDPELWAPQCEEAARLMREGAETVLHTVKMRTDEALLTTEWTKDAEPVRNEAGILIPFIPQD